MSVVRLEAMVVRLAVVGDLAAILAVERGVAEAPHWAEAEYRALLEIGLEGGGAVRRCLFVAVVQGRVVGFAVGKVAELGDEVVSELESVAVACGERRRGFGRLLCEAVAAWCREQGARVLALEVRASSVGPNLLYEGMGFGVVGRRPGYYREPVEDALLMRLEL